MIPEITFIGWHNAGKTTVLCAVVKELCRRGRKIVVMKHTKHKYLETNSSGTDSWRLLEAGAEKVVVVTPKSQISLWQNGKAAAGIEGTTLHGRFDMILGEGFKHDPAIPKIEVARKGVSNEGLLKDLVTGVIAMVTDMDVTGIEVFGFHETAALCDLVERIIFDRSLKER
ncbi:MAG: molybdopterin-guanine dinucleotide biosynthesis protein B [Dissulfurimicrobium sp.]|uniref:molybdopterin-guanine dinucleotide biosynthesis protein B n=1 Tax=Dissulfurimicrobium sp. TaxID=2022436 RepID=UPI004048F0C3